MIAKEPINYNDVVKEYDLPEEYERNNVALMCLLRHKETGQVMIVVSTHIFWNPAFDYVKYA